MPKIGPVNVTERTFKLYRNINQLKPTQKTDRRLAQAFAQLKKPDTGSDARYDAIDQLANTFESLQLESILSGAHSFIKPGLESTATDEKDQLRAEAAERMGILIRRKPTSENTYIRYFQREDAYLQQNSDFHEKLLEATPAENENKIIILFAVAKHGAQVAEAAGNQLALISLGAFAKASSELRRLAGFLFSELIRNEKTFNRKAMWEDMGGLTLEQILSERKSRKQRTRFFEKKYGIRSNEIDSAEQLNDILTSYGEGIYSSVSEYFDSLPQIMGGKVIIISTNFWRTYVGRDWFVLHRHLHLFRPLNKQLSFFMPQGAELKWKAVNDLMTLL